MCTPSVYLHSFPHFTSIFSPLLILIKSLITFLPHHLSIFTNYLLVKIKNFPLVLSCNIQQNVLAFCLYFDYILHYIFLIDSSSKCMMQCVAGFLFHHTNCSIALCIVSCCSASLSILFFKKVQKLAWQWRLVEINMALKKLVCHVFHCTCHYLCVSFLSPSCLGTSIIVWYLLAIKSMKTTGVLWITPNLGTWAEEVWEIVGNE
jgi:hypothetical protein